MSQKANGNSPAIDLSALSGIFAPNSKMLGMMAGNPFTSQNGPSSSPAAGGAIGAGILGAGAVKANGLPGTVPRMFRPAKPPTNSDGVMSNPSPMRPSMMGGSPFLPFQF